jgi:hypothetical protein
MNVKSLVRPKFGVDRRPFAIFTPKSGGCGESGIASIGWSEKYYKEDGLKDFVNEFLFEGSDAGIQRFICMYPAGSAGSLGSANIYRSINEQYIEISSGSNSCIRNNPFLIWGDPVNEWKKLLSEWREANGRYSSFSVGMSLLQPSKGFGDTSSLGYKGEILGVSNSNQQFLSWLSYNIIGWKGIGADSIAMSSINNPNYYAPRTGMSIQEFVLRNFDMPCIGVGMPHDRTLVGRFGDAAYSFSPFVLRDFDSSNGLSALGGYWDPDRTEIHATLNASEVSENLISSYFNRGIIPGVEFDPEYKEDFINACLMVSEMCSQLESKRLSTSGRNMTVFSMVAGDQRNASGEIDQRYGSLLSSKANESDFILPVIRTNCSSVVYPSDPDRLFIPSWWWSNNRLNCPDPHMLNSVVANWMDKEFSKKILLSNSYSPYGTTGPEKCADACFDLMLQYIAKYASYQDKPMSHSYDIVISLENWGFGSFCSDNGSGGIVDGECRLFGHPEDRLNSSSMYPPLFDLASPFSLHGKNECIEWMDRFFYRLKYRRNGYTIVSGSNSPPLPSKIILSSMNIPSSTHLMFDKISRKDASLLIGKDIKRNIESLYGNLSSILSDERYYNFKFDNESMSDMYSDALDSAIYDVDAVSPDSSGTTGSYGLKDARSDKDYLLYQPNAPMRRWYDATMKHLTSYYVKEIFDSVVSKHVIGLSWGIKGISVSNTNQYPIYDVSSFISSNLIVPSSVNWCYGKLSLPPENRMHISRLAMPGLHGQIIPKGSLINCFDIAGSDRIKDGSYMPYWGAGYIRPIVSISSRIDKNDNLPSISVEEDRSKWNDIAGSVFASKDASTSYLIKGSKSSYQSLASNDIKSISKAMELANLEANISVIKSSIKGVEGTDIISVPIIRGSAVADASWYKNEIGNMKTGQPTSNAYSTKYRINKNHLVDLMKEIKSNGCSAVIHEPYAHVVADWNNLYDSVVELNSSNNNVNSTINSVPSVPVYPVQIQDEVASSYAVSISYDFAYMSNFMQIQSRPYISVDEELFKNNILAITIKSSDNKSLFSLPVVPTSQLRAIDIVNIISKQPGMICKILNGNSNIPVSGLSIVKDSSNNSGWLFLAINNVNKISKTSSEARARPLDYIRLKNTSMDSDLYQENASMSFGGFASDVDSFNIHTISSPIYLDSNVLKTELYIPVGDFVASVNGEIMSISSSGIAESKILRRGMFGSRRKMHIPGDQIIIGVSGIFDNRFGNNQTEFEQYRCFVLKNISRKNTVHSLSFTGKSESSSFKIEMAIEVPLFNYKNVIVKSSGSKFVQSDEFKFSPEVAKTLIGTHIGIDTPSGAVIKRTISNIEENIAYINSSLPYILPTGSVVNCYGSKSGYSAGGLFYPTDVGNKRTDFYTIMSGDKIDISSLNIEEANFLKPSEYLYVWFRRRMYKGVRSMDSGNFMPNITFEVS